ncbi:MAG: prepilin-type N-terminal cleavage/methylation domain-containing protein, partial [Bacilli bacterium]|nr:prepilin-type N-terminal cleavage/methylation domain-containing protein [Bacilli bacterium]
MRIGDIMNKKGFTFVEMLFVISFIAVLMLIAIPNLSGLLKQSNDNKYKAFLNDVYLATEAYVQKNIEDYSTLEGVGGIAYIYMSDLVTSNYLRSTIINPNYCDSNNNCSSKKISTCDKNGNNCTIDDYTVIVTKGEDGLYSYELFNKILSGEYKETILNGAYPQISGDLVPVTLDDDGTVKKANLNNRWYSYKRKEWANAVILVDNTISYEDGEEIPEENIESYFVWIPRYKYKLFNLGEYTEAISEKPETSIAHTIEIVFESKDT